LDRAKWKEDYEDDFEKLKDILCKSQAKHFPDYLLDWLLRTDASDNAVAATLLQLREVQGKVLYEIVGFKSPKLTGAAKR
jgi:hypothetical protein